MKTETDSYTITASLDHSLNIVSESSTYISSEQASLLGVSIVL